MEQALLALRWYLVVQLFGAAALPLCLRLFRHLPDRGYGVSKALGLLLAGWVFWLMATLGWVRNTVGGTLVALSIVAGCGFFLYLTKHRADRPAFPWRAVVVTEVVFGLAFIAWCTVRAHMPRIQTAGGEKWMEIAFLRAILRSETFPPHDPWLSGFAISYYYFGYVIVAMLTKMTAVSASIAFNLGIATLFALTCAGAFSLVHNLLAVGRKYRQGEAQTGWGAIWGGLLGPVLVTVTGNLEGLLEVLYAQGIGSQAFWRWLDVGLLAENPQPFTERFFWWWQASRVIRDYGPAGGHQEVIDEFPAFSFLLGDMHPHVLGLPFVLLALALALNLYLWVLRRERQGILAASHTDLPGWIPEWVREALSDWPLAGWEFLIYAICLGGLGFLNTWDFPIYLFVVAAAYTLGCGCGTQPAGQTAPPWRAAFHVPRFGLLFISLLAAGLALYFPFWRGFQSQASGILPNLFNGTRLTQFLVMFGPLAFLAAAFILFRARRAGVQAWRILAITLTVVAGIFVAVVLVVGIAVLLVQRGLIPPQGALSYVDAWLRGEPFPGVGEVPGIWVLVRQRVALDPEIFGASSPEIPQWAIVARSALASAVWTILGLTVLIVAAVLTLGRRWSSHLAPPAEMQGTEAPGTGFALLLFATGALLILGVEFVYLKDVFSTRMNTVFKFYFQAWALWGIAGAYALASFARQSGATSTAVTLVAALLIAAGLIYPALAIPKRAAEYGDPPTLDGAAYLARMYPGDYAAIAWLNENVTGAPVILEAPGGGYEYEGRVSAHTGLPTLLGWARHEQQWRGNNEEQDRREPDIETLYTSTNAQEVLTLLDKYGISYVYVGPVERRRYPAEGLAKFKTLLEIAYESEDVTIYHYRR